MSAFEPALVQEIKDDATLASLLSDGSGGVNVFPAVVPDSHLETYDNFITYIRINTGHIQDVGIERPTFQITCISRDFGNCITMKDNLLNIFQRFDGVLGSGGNTKEVKFIHVENTVQLYHQETKTHMIAMDFVFKGLENTV